MPTRACSNHLNAVSAHARALRVFCRSRAIHMVQFSASSSQPAPHHQYRHADRSCRPVLATKCMQSHQLPTDARWAQPGSGVIRLWQARQLQHACSCHSVPVTANFRAVVATVPGGPTYCRGKQWQRRPRTPSVAGQHVVPTRRQPCHWQDAHPVIPLAANTRHTLGGSSESHIDAHTNPADQLPQRHQVPVKRNATALPSPPSLLRPFTDPPSKHMPLLRPRLAASDWSLVSGHWSLRQPARRLLRDDAL